MKNLKKRVKAVLLAAVMVLCTFVNVIPANAASISADQYLKKMTKAANKVNSYEATSTSVQNMVTNGETTYSKTVQKIIFFNKPKKAKVVTTTTMKIGDTTDKQKVITYAKKNSKGKIVTYLSLDGKKFNKMDVSGITDSLKSIDTDLYSNAKIVKENVKLNNVNTVQISAEISGEDIGKSFSTIFSELGLGDELSFDTSALKPIKVTLWIDAKTYLPVKISMNMTEFVEGYTAMLLQMITAEDPEAAADINISYTKAISTVTYSKYNKATNFTIPKACK